MNLRETILKLSGKIVSVDELQKLVDQLKNDKPVEQKLGKVIKMAKANKITRFKINITGAFRKLLSGEKPKAGKIVPFHTDDIAGLEGLDHYTPAEALELGIIDGLGKLNNKDVYKTINARILEALKKDDLIYRKPWKDGIRVKGKTIGAQNYVTQNPYHGFNAWSIWLTNLTNKTEHQYFLTKKQVADRGGELKENAKGIVVAAFIRSIKKVPHPTKPGETISQKLQGVVAYKVYPIEHTKGVKLIKRNKFKEETDIDQILITPQLVIDNMPKAPKIYNQGNRAFYRSNDDVVYMPPKKAFSKMEEYYSTLFHELVHSTGNPKRIGRKFGKKFGDKDYAFEELIAELGAAYLCGVTDIEYFTLDNSAAYLKSWASALRSEIRQDQTFLFRAILGATKAAKFIIGETIVKAATKAKDKKNKKILDVLFAPPKKLTQNAKKVTRKVKKMPTNQVQMDLKGTGKDAFKKVELITEINTTLAKKISIPSGKVYLLKGDNKFGLTHIVNEHEHEIKKKYGVFSKEFVKTIGDNFTEIRQGKNGRLILVAYGKGIELAVIELLRKDKIYSINTAFPSDNRYIAKFKVLYKRSGPLSGLSSLSGSLGTTGRTLEETTPAYATPNATKVQNQIQSSKSKITSAEEMGAMQYETLPFTGDYREWIGNPPKNFKMMVYGEPGFGKSTLTLGFANYLKQWGKVLFASSEEFGAPSLTEKIKRLKVNGIDFNDTIKGIDLTPYQFIFIDSVNDMGLSYEEFKKLIKETYPEKSFILIVQSTKNNNFRGSNDWPHLVEIVCEGYKNDAGKSIVKAKKNRYMLPGTSGTIDVFR